MGLLMGITMGMGFLWIINGYNIISISLMGLLMSITLGMGLLNGIIFRHLYWVQLGSLMELQLYRVLNVY